MRSGKLLMRVKRVKGILTQIQECEAENRASKGRSANRWLAAGFAQKIIITIPNR
jgi:hypothetical protein